MGDERVGNLMRWRLLPTVLACLCFDPVAAQEVEAYAEEFPPYNYLRDGEPAGIATDLLTRACAAAGVICHIHIVPWARAYRMALTQKNSLVFSTARNAERENAFLWVGPIVPRSAFLYTLSTTPFTLDRLQGKDGFVVGTVYNDVTIIDLRQLGVPDSALEYSRTLDDALRKMMGGRVAGVIDTEISVKWFLKTNGYAQSQVKAVLPVFEGDYYYYALNLDSDPVVAQKLRDGLGAVLAARALPEIIDAYLPASAGMVH